MTTNVTTTKIHGYRTVAPLDPSILGMHVGRGTRKNKHRSQSAMARFRRQKGDKLDKTRERFSRDDFSQCW